MEERFGKYRNMEVQHRAAIDKTKDGKYYVWFEPIGGITDHIGMVRNSYPVVGNRLLHPKKWGNRKAALILTEHIIEEQKRIISQAQEYLSGIEQLHSEILQWTDTEVDALHNPWLKK